MHNCLISFVIYVTNEIFKILFTKRKHIKYYYFVNICIYIYIYIYQNKPFILMKFDLFSFSVMKVLKILSIFLYGSSFSLYSSIKELSKSLFQTIIIVKPFFPFHNIFCILKKLLLFFLREISLTFTTILPLFPLFLEIF